MDDHMTGGDQRVGKGPRVALGDVTNKASLRRLRRGNEMKQTHDEVVAKERFAVGSKARTTSALGENFNSFCAPSLLYDF